MPLLLTTAALVLGSPPAPSANLIQNGSSTQGYSGFSSDYIQVATNLTVYAVISNPSTAFTNGYLSYGDHTTGSGLMLFFDGAGSSYDVWRQSVTLAANTNYSFSYYASTPDGGQPSGNDLADLQFKLNGTGASHAVITSQGSNWQVLSDQREHGAIRFR